jgi:hypothetical protein
MSGSEEKIDDSDYQFTILEKGVTAKVRSLNYVGLGIYLYGQPLGNARGGGYAKGWWLDRLGVRSDHKGQWCKETIVNPSRHPG